ncbi:hypothetical protein SAMN05421812_10515 [Asanoa hainanensis]|uniref:Peptidase inhibitor family I36 n=1 Tax=Asanoa hainanensis TaxID=560556 RepID=A0A239M2H7_9ACTN|nr:hypothetical protein [Asanoa hainanensis]SNT36134.1 hypothetical protein SAMN05421812_10515 [Asanoa hainanensis]
MKRKVLSVGLVGVLIALLTAVLTPTAALAAPTPSTSPRVIPELTNQIVPQCPTGYACAVVYRDGPGIGFRYVFRFYHYGTYNLSNWITGGQAFNMQMDDASMRLLGQNGAEIECIPPNDPDPALDWNPVWKIQLSPTPCY